MRKKLFAIFAALVVALTAVAPAGAITGGQPDGVRHPYGALLLVPALTFCSGTLIDEDVVLTAGHCTNFWSNPGEDIGKITEVWITFDSEAAVDPKTWMPIEGEGTWYVANTWHTHPYYVDEEWPFTADYGVVILDEPVEDITPAILPEPYLLDEIIGDTGQTDQRFEDVGYGQAGVQIRRISTCGMRRNRASNRPRVSSGMVRGSPPETSTSRTERFDSMYAMACSHPWPFEVLPSCLPTMRERVQ